MIDGQLRPVLEGKRRSSSASPTGVHRLRLRQGVPVRRGRPRRFVAEREGATLCRTARPRAQASITGEVDVSVPGQLEAIFERIAKMGKLDILVHSIAFAPKDDLRAAFSIVPPKALLRRWTFPAIPSSEWPSSRRR